MRYQNFLITNLPQHIIIKLGAHNFRSTLKNLVEFLTSRCIELKKLIRGNYIKFIGFKSLLLIIDKIQFAMDLLAMILLVFLILNFLRRSLPWLYKNFIGPVIFGPNVDFSDLGDWACKFNFYFLILFIFIFFVVFILPVCFYN